MGRLETYRRLYVYFTAFRTCTRQAEHQIQVQIVEAGLLRDFDRAQRLARRMHPAQRLEKGVVETLDADRQPIDAERAELGEFLAFESAGIRFERDLDIVNPSKLFLYATKQTVERFRRKQARRAAADKNAVEWPGDAIAPNILGQIAQ